MTEPVTEVLEGQFWAALKPLMDLLGVTPFHIYGGIEITGVADEDDGRWHIKFQRAVERGAPELPWPKVKTGEDEYAEWAYEVDITVKPQSGGDAFAFWHQSLYPEGTPVTEGES